MSCDLTEKKWEKENAQKSPEMRFCEIAEKSKNSLNDNGEKIDHP